MMRFRVLRPPGSTFEIHELFGGRARLVIALRGEQLDFW